jgi:AcrR family transcriptional regulator
VPRTIPENRFKDLIECATREFIARGFRLTQMSDVADALGVAKGTLYLYVESKEALFDAVLRFADGHAPPASEIALPLPTAAPGSLADEVRATLASEVLPPSLAAALERKAAPDVRAELEAIVRELYALASRRRTAIKLIDRCAGDLPELASLFYAGGRLAQLEALTAYLAARIDQGVLAPVRDLPTTARFVIEAIVTWAVHIHWDPAPQKIDPADAEETLVHFVLAGLLKE